MTSEPLPPDASAPHPGRRWRPAIVIVAALLLVAFGVAHLAKTRGSGTMGGRPLAAVGVGTATRADVPVTLTALGTVQPVVAATVRAQQAGVLFRLLFREGQLVHAGQVIAQIDPRPYRLALAQAQANLARDAAQFAAAQVDLARYRTLLTQDSIAGQQVDTQRATVRQLAGTIAADRAAIGTARLNLDYTAIKAPVTGRAGIRQVDIGNYLTPADTNGIVLVTQVDPIDVSFALPQSALGSVGRTIGSGAGLPVAVLGQADGRTIATGRFLTFDNAVDTTTGTVKAKARFDNAANALFPNQFVNVSLLVDTLRGAVTVPVSAVRHGVPGDFVFVLRPDDTVKLTVVKTGPSVGDRIAILSGLAAGATVVTEGADGLDDGAAVRLPGKSQGKDGGKGGAGGHRHRAHAAGA